MNTNPNCTSFDKPEELKDMADTLERMEFWVQGFEASGRTGPPGAFALKGIINALRDRVRYCASKITGEQPKGKKS